MTRNTSTGELGSFDQSLMKCVDEINKLLPGLGQRYHSTVIMSAMAEHVGSALKVLMQRRVCNVRQAQQVIQNIENSAFLKKPDLRVVPALPAESMAPAPAEDPDDTDEKT